MTKPKALVATLDGIDEGIKGFYSEITDEVAGSNEHLAAFKGQYFFDLEGAEGWANEPVAGLKSALSKKSAAATGNQAELEAWKGLEMTTDEVRAKLKTLEDLGDVSKLSDSSKVQARLDAVEEQWKGKLDEQTKTSTAREAMLIGVIDEAIRKSIATQAIVAEGGDPELLLPHVLMATRTVETEPGKFAVRVLGSGGPDDFRITAKAGETGHMDVAELVSGDLKTKFPAGFKGSGASGTGSGEHKDQPGGGTKVIGKAAFEAGEYDPADVTSGKVLVDITKP